MRKNKGFTLIELMIVIAIIAIIAAIAIPNLIQSRIRANEASAISVIKQIAAAQVQFQVARQGRLSSNTGATRTGYADNYRNLYYGNPHGDSANANLALISKAIADAWAIEDNNTGTRGTPTPKGAQLAYQGYHFVEPDGVGSTDFATSYAIIAVPNNAARTGTNSYYLGEDGTVYQKGLTASWVVGTNLDDMRTDKNLMQDKHADFAGAGWESM